MKIHDIANSTMIVDRAALNYFGDSAKAVVVSDGGSPTLDVLGKTEGPIRSRRGVFGDLTFELRDLPGSAYLAVHFLDGGEPGERPAGF